MLQEGRKALLTHMEKTYELRRFVLIRSIPTSKAPHKIAIILRVTVVESSPFATPNTVQKI